MSDEALNSTAFNAIGAIYDAAVDPDRWGVALDAVAEAVGARACALLVRGTDDLPYDINALSSAYRDFVARPEGQHYLSELRAFEAPDWDAFARQPVGQTFPDEAVGITRACLDTRPDCIALERHVGLRRRLGVRLNDTPVWFDGMTLGFRPGLEALPITALEPLVPHLARAIEMGRTFAALRARYRAVLGVLDRVSAGLAIALPDGQVIVCNTEAERILATRDGVTLDRARRLHAASYADSLVIRRGIAAAAATAGGEGCDTETRINLKRRDHPSPLLLDITPLHDSAHELDMHLKGALITLIDPDRTRRLNVERFAQLHGFSAAERDVCRLLLDGHGVDEIAERRGTAQSTAKNQITRLLTKAGARTRFELVRKIIRTLPPLV
ncbi:MAG: hypothetical protein JJU15_16930 [Pararhodobacter sp.]|nr:hypothetical protein [Pararhodobacter sp.]